MRFRQSFWATLAQNEETAPDLIENAIRKAMLDAIDELCTMDIRQLEHRVQSAPDISALWSLRAELMKSIQEDQGEEVARNRINELTELFRQY